jgi:hypothetical protein
MMGWVAHESGFSTVNQQPDNFHECENVGQNYLLVFKNIMVNGGLVMYCYSPLVKTAWLPGCPVT